MHAPRKSSRYQEHPGRRGSLHDGTQRNLTRARSGSGRTQPACPRHVLLKLRQAAASGPSPPSFPVSNRVLPDAEKGREFRLGQSEPLPSLQDPLWEVHSYREREVAKELGDPPEVLRAGLGLAQLRLAPKQA